MIKLEKIIKLDNNLSDKDKEDYIIISLCILVVLNIIFLNIDVPLIIEIIFAFIDGIAITILIWLYLKIYERKRIDDVLKIIDGDDP